MTQPQWSEANDQTTESYQSFNLFAIITLLLGVLSLLGLLNAVFLVFAVLTIIACAIAMRAIIADPDHVAGGGLARMGLFLAVTCLVAVPIRYAIFERMITQQGLQVSAEFVEYLQADQPAWAKQMQVYPWRRTRAVKYEEVLDMYSVGMAAEDYQGFIDNPTIRFLTAIGKAINIRFLEVSSIYESSDGTIQVQLYYELTGNVPADNQEAITALHRMMGNRQQDYDLLLKPSDTVGQDEHVSCVMGVTLERIANESLKKFGWRVVNVKAPAELPQQ